jgi:hypothetical protein
MLSLFQRITASDGQKGREVRLAARAKEGIHRCDD